MKLAITTWCQRVAPVFDVTQNIITIETSETGEQIRDEFQMAASLNARERVIFLVNHDIDELICGAISCPIYEFSLSQGITIHPFIAGDIESVIDAWENNNLDDSHFNMPGCLRRGRRRRCQQTRCN